MREPPPLFRYRTEQAQVLLGGVVPFVFGIVVGITVGVSASAYWVLVILAAIGAVLAGFEHPDGWGGADRGLVGGAIYGVGVVLAHYVSGADAKVSLGSFPPLLIIIDAIAGMLLGALGGRIGRSIWDRTPPTEEPAAGPPAEEPAAGPPAEEPAPTPTSQP